MSTAAATHPVSAEEIMALLDGELSADRAQSVSAHTESCPACQQTFASLLHTAHSLSSWTVGQIPFKTEDHAVAAAARIGSSSQAFGTRNALDLLRRKPSRQLLGLAACGFAFIFLIVMSMDRAARPKLDSSILYRQKAVSVDDARVTNPAHQEALDSNGNWHGIGGKAEDSFSVDGQLASSDAREGVNLRLAEKGKNSVGPLSQGFERSSAESGIHNSLASGPMIARTVSLAILVKDFDASRKSLDSVLVRHNGYAANLSASTPEASARSLQASLRIPAPQLAAALAELKSLGHVENESQNGEEVTQQHADLLARLKNSHETEQRLQAILTERTGKISDVLSVEQEIARVRGEIEQMEAEQKNLEHRVDFAAIDLKLSEEYKAKLDSAAPSLSTQFHNALVNGYRNVADTLVALLLFFAEYGPILLFWSALLSAPAWLLWRRWRHAAAAA